MSGKKLIIITAVLALASFAITFLATHWLTAPQPGRQALEARKARVNAMALAGVEGPSVQGERLADLIKQVQQRIRAEKRRGAKLDMREKRLQMAEEQLKKDIMELDTLRSKLDAPLARLRALKKDLDDTRVQIMRQEQDNLKRIAKVVEKMSGQLGRDRLVDMCNNEQTDDAVKILHYMSGKHAAKIIGEVEDGKLVTRLMDGLKRIKEEG